MGFGVLIAPVGPEGCGIQMNSDFCETSLGLFQTDQTY